MQRGGLHAAVVKSDGDGAPRADAVDWADHEK
ncbi:MAG: hypothetical protein JWQ03_1327 [Variovorax sp.]|nr:hypothetical protein [Variovorax sp.]